MDEFMKDRDYDKSTSSDSARLCLVDVGAMGGLQTKWHPFSGLLSPILFEPNPLEAARLRAQLPNATVIEAALSNVVGRQNLIITENPTCISLRSPNGTFLSHYGINPHFNVKERLEVECTRYDELFRQGVVPSPDAIKLDVQGCEYEALLGFGSLLQDCIGVELEAHFFPLYQNQRLLHEIISLLSDYGFVLRKLDQNKMDNFDGDLVEVDAFFTKPRATVRSYNPDQRRKFDLLTEVWKLHQYRF
jgi:FkbM family methyltransferase